MKSLFLKHTRNYVGWTFVLLQVCEALLSHMAHNSDTPGVCAYTHAYIGYIHNTDIHTYWYIITNNSLMNTWHFRRHYWANRGLIFVSGLRAGAYARKNAFVRNLKGIQMHKFYSMLYSLPCPAAFKGHGRSCQYVHVLFQYLGSANLSERLLLGFTAVRL